jgi:hypothetical protein
MLETLRNTAPNVNPFYVINTGASEIRQVFKGEDLAAVVGAYMVGIQDVFAFSLGASAAAAVLAMAIPFKKLPDHDNKKNDEKGTAV